LAPRASIGSTPRASQPCPLRLTGTAGFASP
jgi:hypothetical protein